MATDPNFSPRIVMCACHEVGLDMLEHLFQSDIPISHIVTLTAEQAKRELVSGYASFEAMAKKHNLPIYYPKTYSLTHPEDVSFFSKHNFDLLILGGWQRLIPGTVLQTLKFGGLGAHGSSEFLPKGRGRSPINWSLIQGKERFIVHLFFMKEGADDGNIIDHDFFDINVWDDCRTLYYKNAVVTKRLLVKNIPKIFLSSIKGEPQEGEPTYFPKRTADDGRINWNQGVMSLYNLIRAVTRPYPGAFTELNGQRLYLWKAQPFDSHISYPEACVGEVVEVFSTGDFVVKVPDGLLLVTESSSQPERGQVFPL